MKKAQKKWLLIILQIAITVFFLYLTFHNTQFHALGAAVANINYWLVCLTLIPQLIIFFLLAAREKCLLQKIHPFHFRDLFEGAVIGFVGNNVLPFRGGEFLKVLYWSKRSSKSYVSLLSVALIERLLDLACLIFLFFVGSKSILTKLGVDITWVIAVFIGVVLFMLLLIFLDWKYKREFALHKSIQVVFGHSITHWCNDFLNKVMQGIRILGDFKNIFFALCFTIAYWLVTMGIVVMLLYAFHLTVMWQEVIVIVLATSFGSAIPAAPGYIGTFDYFSKMSLVLYGVSASVAASFAIVSHVILMVPFTILGILFVYPVLKRLMKSPASR